MAVPQIIEVPFGLGGAVSGADLGIAALKKAAREAGSALFNHDISVDTDALNQIKSKKNKYPYLHYGDKVLHVIKSTSARVCAALKKGLFPIVVAGDHSTAAGTIGGILKAFPNERVGVVWIDAHADLHSPYTTPSGNAHGMTLAMATGTDNGSSFKQSPGPDTVRLWEEIKNAVSEGSGLDLKDIVFVGGRSFDPEEKALLEKIGNVNFTVANVGDDGVTQIVNEIFDELDHCTKVYISFDVDSIDPSFSEGTGTPVIGGFDYEQIYNLNGLLVENKKVCCWEMVEINPLLDNGNKMATGCFRILEHVYNTIAKR